MKYEWIKRNFDSLNNQGNNYFNFFEAIIVDDGSNQETKENIKLLLKKAKFNHKLITKENGGWGSAINYAIENAKGEYGFYLDADDEIEKDFVKKFSSFDLKKDKTIAYSINSMKMGLDNSVDSKASFNGKAFIDLKKDKANKFPELPQLIVSMSILRGITIPSITWNADMTYFVSVYNNISKIYTIDIWYIYHYLRPGNTNTSKITEKQFYEVEKAALYLMSFEKNNDFAIRKYLFTLINYARAAHLVKKPIKSNIKAEIYHYIKYKPFSIYNSHIFRLLSLFLPKKLILFLVTTKK